MANKKITEVTQVSSVASTDDFYIKTGNNFRRVQVSKLEELLETNGFYQVPEGGIPKSDLSAGSNPKWGFGCAVCTTGTSTAAKTASLTGYTLEAGGFVAVRFTNAVDGGATLSINSQDAKAIYHNGVALPSNVIRAGDTAVLVYDGSYYQLVSILPSGPNFIHMTISGSTVSLPMSFANAYSSFSAPWQTFLMLEVDTNVVLLLRPSKVDAENLQIYAEAVVGTTLYSVTLTQYGGSSVMTGTLSTTQIGSGSGASVLAVEFDIAGTTPTCDQTFSDISAAIAANSVIKPVFSDYIGIVGDVSSIAVNFYFFDYLTSTPTLYIFTVDSSDNVTVASKTLGDAIDPTIVTDSSASPSSFAAAANTVYKFTAAALTSLTVSSVPASGEFTLVFTSGSTATTLTLPQTLTDRMPSGFAVEANTRYEINVSDGWPVVGSWPVSS